MADRNNQMQASATRKMLIHFHAFGHKHVQIELYGYTFMQFGASMFKLWHIETI